MAWRDRERWLNFVFLDDGRVEDKKERDEKVWGNHHEKLRLEIISCVSQFTIPNKSGTSPDPACNSTDTRSSNLNQTSRTPDFSYPLVSSISFSSSFPSSPFLVHNSTIIAEHKVKSSLSISPCHDYELTPSTAYTAHCIIPRSTVSHA